MPALTKSYWDTVYGIYDVIPHPVDPRRRGRPARCSAASTARCAVRHRPSPLEKPLRPTGKPFVLVRSGPAARRTRVASSAAGRCRARTTGETWRASFDEPGVLARDDFQDRGYRWLIVRLTEGPQGGRKTIAVNGQVVGEFVRTGPPVTEKKEWWVTRSYPIPAGLLKNGQLEIRFTDPGIAIAAVALSADRIPDTEVVAVRRGRVFRNLFLAGKAFSLFLRQVVHPAKNELLNTRP